MDWRHSSIPSRLLISLITQRSIFNEKAKCNTETGDTKLSIVMADWMRYKFFEMRLGIVVVVLHMHMIEQGELVSF